MIQLAEIFDNTQSIKDAADFGRFRIPPTPKGKEVYTLKRGELVESTGIGPVKGGLRGRVLSREKNNGFNRYQIAWEKGFTTFEREQDVKRKDTEK